MFSPYSFRLLVMFVLLKFFVVLTIPDHSNSFRSVSSSNLNRVEDYLSSTLRFPPSFPLVQPLYRTFFSCLHPPRYVQVPVFFDGPSSSSKYESSPPYTQTFRPTPFDFFRDLSFDVSDLDEVQLYHVRFDGRPTYVIYKKFLLLLSFPCRL